MAPVLALEGRSCFAQRSAGLWLVGLLPGPRCCQAGPGPCLGSIRGTPRWTPLPPLCPALPQLTGTPVAPRVSICSCRQKRVLDSSRIRPLQLEPSRVSGPQAPWQGLKGPRSGPRARGTPWRTGPRPGQNCQLHPRGACSAGGGWGGARLGPRAAGLREVPAKRPQRLHLRGPQGLGGPHRCKRGASCLLWSPPGRAAPPLLPSWGVAPRWRQHWPRNHQCLLVHPERRLRWPGVWLQAEESEAFERGGPRGPPAACPLWDRAARCRVPRRHCRMLPILLPLFSEGHGPVLEGSLAHDPSRAGLQGGARVSSTTQTSASSSAGGGHRRKPLDAGALPPAPLESALQALTAACSPGGGCGGGLPGRVGITAQGGLQHWQPLGTAQPGMESCQPHPTPYQSSLVLLKDQVSPGWDRR